MANRSDTPRVPILVLSTAKAGGAERALAHLVRRLPQHGFDPTVLLLEPGPMEGWLEAAGCRSVVAASADEVPAIAHHLIDEGGAQLLVSGKSQAHAQGGQIARAADIPSVWWQRDIARLSPTHVGAAAQPVDAIVCSSRLTLEAQRRLTPSERIVQIPPGIPVSPIASRATRTPRARGGCESARAPRVGIVGRLQHFKAQHVFLRAAALVAKERPDARFVVVGGALTDADREYLSWLSALSRRLEIADRVRFVGHQSDVVPWLDGLDVVVNATAGEPFGLVLVEAMALGTPVVATNLGGPAEIIEDRESGLLVAPGDPDATAGAILEILEDPGLRGRLSAAGRRRAWSFTAERMTAGFAALLRSL